MRSWKGFSLIALGLLLVVFLTACGGGMTTGAQGTGNTTTMTQPQQTQGANQNNKQVADPNKATNVGQTNQNAGMNNGQMTNQTTPTGTMNGQGNSPQVHPPTQQQNPAPANPPAQGNGNNYNGNGKSATKTPTPAPTTAPTNGQNNGQGNGQNNGNGQGNGNGQNNGNGNGQGNGTPTLISTRQVMINGQPTTVLTNGSGMTLYTYSADPAGQSTCTGGCAQNWPAVLSNGGQIIPSSNFPGNLTVKKTVNGDQIAYNGQVLYTYVGDTAPEQANGQGIGNAWNVITVMLPKQHW